MFSLIITIITLALVVALSLAFVYTRIGSLSVADLATPYRYSNLV